METKDKKILWGIAGVLVLVVLIFVFADNISTNQEQEQDKNQESVINESDDAKITQQSADESLDAFPEGFPVEEGISEASGYEYVPAQSSEQQSTLEYTSSRSLEENAIRFREFITQNGFELINETDEPGLVFLYAQKDGDDLSISIEEREGEVKVTASYLNR